jgi:hypothetical protein
VKRNPFGVESKVARPAALWVIASAVLGFIHYYAPQWNLPPVPLVVLALGAVSTAVGYNAPHTPRLKQLTAEELAVMDRALATPQPVIPSPVSHTGPPGSTVTYVTGSGMQKPPATTEGTTP